MHLVALAGHPARQSGSFSWPRVEASLGHRLPGDYRRLLEALPAGSFRRLVRLNRPGDHDHPDTEFLGFYAHRLNDLRSWREAGRVPYPIFPEPGGLLPWASGPRLEQIFWRTGDYDPDRWPVVLADAGCTRWKEHPGPAARFLADAIEGRFDTTPFGYDLAARDRPIFVPDEPEPDLGPGLGYRPARQFFGRTGQPADEFRRLAALLGTQDAPAGVTAPSALPVDYRRFLAQYGPGILGEINIPVLGAALLDDIHARLRLRHFPCAVHPEPGGLITWGTAGDGWLLAWAPTSPDPDRWGTVAITSDLVTVRHAPDWSFSGLLRRYADPAEDPPVMLSGLARPAPPPRYRSGDTPN